jgi:RND family efflux transporter MFP subunit
VNSRFSKYVLILALLPPAAVQPACRLFENPDGSDAALNNQTSELVVKAEPVKRQEWVAAVPFSGTLRSQSVVDVKTEVGGRLIAVYFEEGDFVQKDRLLAEIDPVNYRLAYDQAAAALAVAEAGLERAKVAAEHARTEKERADNLLRTGGITQKDHQAAETGVKEAESQVRLAEAQIGQARAALAVAEKALRDCKIHAPTQGHVQQKTYDRGSLLVPGVSICTLVDNSRLELECDVPSYQLAAIRVGQRAAFTTPTFGERRFDGVVSSINPAVQAENRSVRVKLKIGNPGGELRSGMYARGEIVTGRESGVLVVPRDALIPEEEGGSGSGVFVVRDGKARRVGIQIGGSQADRVWVREGLSEGDVVITEIGPALKDGTAVRVE